MIVHVAEPGGQQRFPTVANAFDICSIVIKGREMKRAVDIYGNRKSSGQRSGRV